MFFGIAQSLGSIPSIKNWTYKGMAFLALTEIILIALVILSYVKNPIISISFKVKVGLIVGASFIVLIDCGNIYVRKVHTRLGAVFFEPWETLRFSFLYLRGRKIEFTECGFNPKTVQRKRQYNPILLIHGYWHNHSAWIPLGQSNILDNRLVYTINLTLDKDKDKRLINEKIAQIHELTGKTVDLVGHSYGGFLADLFAMNRKVRTVILLGMGSKKRSEHEKHNIWELMGSKDGLVPLRQTRLDADKRIVFPSCGHLGLLSEPAVHREIGNILGANDD